MLSYDNPILENCISSLYKNTRMPFHLTIVNNSGANSEHATRILELSKEFDFEVIHARNYWILSLNSPYIQSILSQCESYVITDDDILFPEPINHVCWLSFLSNCIEKYPFLGKIGLPLETTDLSSPESIRAHYLDPNRLLFDCFYSIPVDTTPAIYRKNLFIPGTNRFSPRHMSLVKPHLYNVRINTFSVRSLSSFDPALSQNTIRLARKAICFANTSASLEQTSLINTPIWARYYYKLVRPLVWLFWAIEALIRLLIYMVLQMGILNPFNNLRK